MSSHKQDDVAGELLSLSKLDILQRVTDQSKGMGAGTACTHFAFIGNTRVIQKQKVVVILT
eukprot:CAMPEP_0194377392 /NCGR_PEP_ID=MMETSP0174-20130528/30644_1 /TAXON_ID=216777 /ORGANISM="Proboscia alata, Strain PI-D3" /LENGTH=60 /DNA_ID=CAMNT_0039158715 /DNA_START=169 /DNA_END=347 /DNA_ORIENTATION=-